MLDSLQLSSMKNQAELLGSLQQYIVELQNQNRALQNHIFTIQNKAETTQRTFHEQLQKSKVYAEHCEHQIIKREKRQVNLLEVIQELQSSKEELQKERDIYVQEIDNIRKQCKSKQDQIIRISAIQASKPPQPKPIKCKNCQVYLKNQQFLQRQVRQKDEVIQQLREDLDCLSQFV